MNKLFTQDQLSLIQACARVCNEDGSGELSVAKAVEHAAAGSFSQTLLNIVSFCAEECRRQGSGELSVHWMLTAYDVAFTKAQTGEAFAPEDILQLAALIEPEKNANGYRKVNVSFANMSVVGWQNIEHQIESLMDAAARLTVEEFTAQDVYVEFEKIHPMLDGNGRLGKILFNARNNTLLEPIFPAEPF